MRRGDRATLKFFIYGEASRLGATVKPRAVEPTEVMGVANTIGPYQAAERIAERYTAYMPETAANRRPFVVVDCGSVSRQLAAETYGVDRAVYLARIRQRRARKVLIVLFWLEASQDAPSDRTTERLAYLSTQHPELSYDELVTLDSQPADHAPAASCQCPACLRMAASFATPEPPSAAPIVEPTPGQSVSAGLYLEMCERFGAERVLSLLTATAGAAREARPLKLDYAMLVYQAGIANVFQVDAIELTPDGRNARRIYQGDFRGAELIAVGLATAGVAVRSAGCNMAGDITDREWTFDLDSLPFSDKFNAVHEG